MTQKRIRRESPKARAARFRHLGADGNLDAHRCDFQNKRSWPTEKQARTEAARKAKIHHVSTRHYLCPECKRWHLTTQGST